MGAILKFHPINIIISKVSHLRHNSVSPRQILLRVPDLPVPRDEVLLGLEVLHEAGGAVQPLLGAVHPPPGLAGEVAHVVHRAVGAELAKHLSFVADVVQLTLGLKVSIIPSKQSVWITEYGAG